MKQTKNPAGLRNHLAAEAGFNISWAAILAGVVTFFASLAVLSLIGSAIGFGVVEPTSSHPFSGVGTGVLIWTVVSLVIAFMAGGFISGVAARRVGMLHGFLTWATSVLLLMVMLTYLAATTVSAVGTLFGSAFSFIGEGASSVASGVGDLVSDSFDSITNNLGDVDNAELQNQMEDILRDTDTPELQPEYLNNQLQESRDEIMQAGKELAVNPDQSEEILNSLTQSLQERAETIGNAADRDAIAKAVANNTDLSEAEAQQATDNIYNGLQNASKQAQNMLNQASQRIEEAQKQLDRMIASARQSAEDAADATAKASIWAFIALALALVLTTISGIWGSNFVAARNEEIM